MKSFRLPNNGNFFLFYVSFSLFGYSLAAPLSELIFPNVLSSPLTILYRMFVLGGAFLFIFQLMFIKKKTFVNEQGKIIFLLFIFFWCIYTTRLIYDSMFQSNLLGENTIISYITMGYLFVFIPALSLIRSYNETDLKYLFQMSFYILFFGVLLTLCISAFQILSGSWQGGQRLSLERLNPISLGRYSAVLFFLALGLMQLQSKNKILMLCGIFIGISGVLLSGSRGALVGTLFILCINFLLQVNFKNLLFITGLLPIALMLGVFLLSILVPDIDVVENYLRMGGKSDESAQIRYQLYQGAFEQFSNNPIFGDLIIERSFKYYPHNQFLEILMATGVFGFSIFVILNSLLFYKLKCLLKQNKSKEVAIRLLMYLFIFYFVGGVFSGTIIGSLEYWYLVLIISFTYFKKADFFYGKEVIN
ncbi:O-antigen ligase family protein [Flavobacterium sp. W21_SRS_FM6]|uniref:O-antigen ligase family protein n=1 Tax=Flavobacterium sp. W21_SRS_FM6 TaxID=3240268 RepID=UPI003F9294BC